MCNSVVPYENHRGVLINKIASMGAAIVTVQNQIKGLGKSNADRLDRWTLTAKLTGLEAELAKLKEFRDAPEDADVLLP